MEKSVSPVGNSINTPDPSALDGEPPDCDGIVESEGDVTAASWRGRAAVGDNKVLSSSWMNDASVSSERESD